MRSFRVSSSAWPQLPYPVLLAAGRRFPHCIWSVASVPLLPGSLASVTAAGASVLLLQGGRLRLESIRAAHSQSTSQFLVHRSGCPACPPSKVLWTYVLQRGTVDVRPTATPSPTS